MALAWIATKLAKIIFVINKIIPLKLERIYSGRDIRIHEVMKDSRQ